MAVRKYLNLSLLMCLVASLILSGGGLASAQQPTPPGTNPKMQYMEAERQAGSDPMSPAQPSAGTGPDRCKGKMNCIDQIDRMAARKNGAPQTTGVNKTFAGLDPATLTLSPLTPVQPRHGKTSEQDGKAETQAAQAASTLALATMAQPYSTPDYFGVANWANSPLPTLAPGPINAVTLLTGGGGYTNNAVVTVSDPTGSGAAFAVTATAGVIQSIKVVNGGANYSAPMIVSITDPNGIAAGATAFISSYGTLSGGMRKFVDTLPGLCPASAKNDLGQCIPVAVPEKVNGQDVFAGSDFYRLRVKEYNQQMHKDLPAAGTNLRGYVQIDSAGNPVVVTDANGATVASQQYLGPLILATRNRPVRVLFQNSLTTDVQVPMDGTYMGAGMVMDDAKNMMDASQKRAVLHLHGGASPWISDGTPHQWITPAGGDGQPNAKGFMKGISFENVPDMNAVKNPQVPGLPASADSSQNLNDGLGTYLWTNQQSGRLMFYHDHSYGITRLNVYAGEAAGYLLVDPAQETPLKTATVPGTIVTDPNSGAIVSADLAHVVPLVIQDKTFVPDNGAAGGQLAATDPTWPSPANPYTNPVDNQVYSWGAGNLWFPHIYMPNQNPSDNSGASAYGRWDYGPWFWPVFPTAIPPTSCTSVAYPGKTLTCPSTPNPSGTPEGFMDTPVINGTAYPSTTIKPSAYRFQVLSAGNDRTWNLGLYYAVDKNGVVCKGGNTFDAASCTEMSMVPAVPHTNLTTPPLCTATTATAGGGLAAASIDPATGNPLNGTGLPLTATGGTCWPTTWPTDGRDGGVPDPATVGPPIIAIGSEGGLLPNPAVIPSTPMGFEYNRRSVTVLNVFSHGLLLGPAERSDLLVDFSGVPSGSVLLLYNDAPAPVPAFDPRFDYYTSNPDQTPSGGAPSTQPGYGPNTRTIMQIKVSGANDNATPFSLKTLTTALPTIFAATQEPIIVAESAYPVGNGNGIDTYARIQDTSLSAWAGGSVGSLQLTAGGSAYTAVPTVQITGGGGTGATGTATLSPGGVQSLSLSNSGGFGYTAAPAVTFTGGGGTGASAIATIGNGGVRMIMLGSGGSGYLAAPNIQIGPPNAPGCPIGCVQATAVAAVRSTSPNNVTGVTVTNPGAGYVTAPSVKFVAGSGGSGATAIATLGYRVTGFTMTAPSGSGYTSPPSVTVAAPASTNCKPASLCAQATATAFVASSVAGVQLTNGGTGYTSPPTVTIVRAASDTTGAGATAVAMAPSTPLQPKAIQELFTTDYGRMNATLGAEIPATTATVQTTIPYGYIDPPTEILKDGETQLWKVTHNGVDSHFIHFHLFVVQVVNRVGWDGMIKPPDPTEMSWKDTVRMNPLEDIVVALRPIRQTDTLGITAPKGQPFNLPNSIRPLDVTMPTNSTTGFLNVDPSNQPATVVNDVTNFGWEYVWHCHILGHEENDMMRAMVLGTPPIAPTGLGATASGTPANRVVNLSWQDASISETAFTVQKATSASGPWTNLTTIQSAPIAQPTTGTTLTYTDSAVTRGTRYYYRVVANNVVGYTRPFAAPAIGYPYQSVDSAPSTSATIVP